MLKLFHFTKTLLFDAYVSVGDVDRGGRWDWRRIAATQIVDRRRAWTGGTGGLGVAGEWRGDEENVERRLCLKRETQVGRR